jgi:hypothetical protein
VDLPGLPLLPTHGAETIEQLVPQRQGSYHPRCTIASDDFQTVVNLPVKGPSNNEFGFPTKAANLAELADVAYGDTPDGMQVLPVQRADLLNGRVG